MNIVLVFLFFISMTNLASQVIVQANHCLTQVVQTYFQSPVAVFGHSTDKLSSILTLLDANWSVLLFDGPGHPTHNSHKVSNTIVLVEDVNELERRLRNYVENAFWNSNSKFLVILFSRREADIVVIKRLFWDIAFVANVVLVNEDMNFYTWSFQQPKDCDNASVLLIDSCSNKTVKNLNFYSYKRINMNLCPLRVTAAFIPPYSFRESSGYETRGFEDRIIANLAWYLNMTVKFVPPPNGISYYTPRINTTHFGGAFHLLHYHKADLAYGCMKYSMERYFLSESAPSYYEDEFKWFVPLPDPKPTWENLFSVFPRITWILVGSAYFCMSFTFYLLARPPRQVHFSFSSSLLYAWAISLNMQVVVPKNLLFRCFVGFSVIYALHVVQAYQSGLIQVMMKDSFGKPFQNIDEAFDAGLKCLVFPSLRSYSSEFGDRLWARMTQPGTVVYSEDYISGFEAVVNKTSVAPLAEKFVDYFINRFYLDKNGDPKMMKLKQRAILYPVSFFMAKHHSLSPIVNRKVNQLVEAGLIEQWMKEILHSAKKLQIGEEDGNRPITLSHLTGGFFILLFGLAVSIVALHAELIYSLLDSKT